MKAEDRITLHRSREGSHEVTVSRIVETTECEKLAKVSAESQKIGEFLDWLREAKDVRLCVWRDSSGSTRRGDYAPEGLYPLGTRTEQLLAEYFEIDLTKVDNERRALLDALRESRS